MRLRRRKSTPQKVADYLKLEAVAKTAKGAAKRPGTIAKITGKAGKGAAKRPILTAKGAKKAAKGTAAYQVAKRTPVVKRLPVIAGAVVAAFAAVKLVRHGGDEGQAAPA